MRPRTLLGSLLVLVCLATLWGVWGQGSELAGLRAEQQQLLAQLTAGAGRSPSAARAETEGAVSGPHSPTLVATLELLRLRNDVTRLSERRHELVSVRAENERLRAELGSRGTNGPDGFPFPPGFVRKSEARMVGYSRPEDTLQSLLWAVRNHDLTNAAQAFVPEVAKELRGEFEKSSRSMDDYFHNMGGFFGARIADQSRIVEDGSILAEVELAPGMPGPLISLCQTNGQWKITSWP
jgi:hypothetical protein